MNGPTEHEDKKLDAHTGETDRPRHHVTPRRANKAWVIVVIAAAIAAGLIGWQRMAPRSEVAAHADEKPAAPATDLITVDEKQLQQISTDAVKQRLVTVDRKATGKIGFNEDRMTPVFTPYAGRVIELLANKGDDVKVGQPLVVLESPDYIAAQNDLASARSDVAKAKIGLDTAKAGAERARRLHDQEALATKDLQQAEADFARAQDETHRADTALASIVNRLSLFGKGPEDIAKLEEHPDRQVVLPAPIPGTIVDRKIGSGQYVKPDSPDPLFLISDLTTLWVLVDVFESDLAGIRLNTPVEVSVAAYPDRVFPARISFISPTVDPTTRTVRVRCLVANPNGLLKPDMFATIKMGSALQAAMPTIPSSAVVAEGNDSLVFVSEGPGHFRPRRIQVGREIEGGFIVDSGLHAGEIVATRGALLLSEISKSK
jgi:cobalt-zinc-cadmium efflux system membrane fusion protein